jgi:pilus assembly protein CpaB
MAYGLRDGDHVNVIATMLFVDLDLDFQSELPNNTAAVINPGGNAIVLNSREGESVVPQIVYDPLIDPLVAQVATGGATSPEGRAESDPILGNQPFYLVASEAQRARLVSQTLLQDVVILHVGNFLYTDESGEVVTDAYAPQSIGIDASGQPIPSGPKPPPDVVTLIVTPQDAITLNYLLYTGADLTLILRSNGDDSIVNTEAVTLEYLLNTYNIPVPIKLPFGTEPRTNGLISPAERLQLPPEPTQ